MGLLLASAVFAAALLELLILDISEHEDIILALSWLELDLDIVRRHWAPSMSEAVAWFASHYALRVGKLVVKSDE